MHDGGCKPKRCYKRTPGDWLTCQGRDGLRSDECTAPPVGQVVIPHKESINGHRRRIPKNRVMDYERSTTPNEQAWKQQVVDIVPACDLDSRREIKVYVLKQYHCPKCHIGIIRYHSVPGNLKPIPECDNANCSWTVAQMTSAQRAEFNMVDPDSLRIKEHMTGKERRMRNFLGKIAY